MRTCTRILLYTLALAGLALAQPQRESYDSTAVARIREEGLHHSRVMQFLENLTDIYGPRLSGSPAYMAAAQWARGELAAMGLENARLEAWGPWGYGWTLKNYSANIFGRQNFPLISWPKAWSPALPESEAELLFLDARTDSAVLSYSGRIKGKFVMIQDPHETAVPFAAFASRIPDSTLLKMANSDGQRRGGRRFERSPEMIRRQEVAWRKMKLCFDEGARAILTSSQRDGGIIDVAAASWPQHPDSFRTTGPRVYALDAPKLIPQISVGAEHYNRLVRMIQHGEKPRLELEIEAAFNRADSGYNILAELPGTDLKDQVVLIGGHFDSWHGGTGAADNACGCAVAMEAMRILKTLDLKPRRTIRIGLWDAEEHGFLGSRGYISKHLAAREGGVDGRGGKVTLKPEGEKFSVYFNMDNGSGKFRGIYLQGNEACRPIFRAWLKPFSDLGAATITLASTGGTDHQAFDGVGLPGFQFIQDELDYDARVHHSNMDLYERCPSGDLQQAAVIMAAFAYNAAMREAMIPRKPALEPPFAPGPPDGLTPQPDTRKKEGPMRASSLILDRLENAERYFTLHPAFARAFAFLRQPGLAELSLGRHEIDGERLYCSISEGAGKGKEGARLEAHRRYIDIQYVIAGTDVMGWKPASACTAPDGPPDPAKDLILFKDQPERWVEVPPGSFTIFFPEDAHAPMGGAGTIRKAVVKVAVE
ncbi:MAG TPA: YhcH/YjgK/YiaL family protein [bacterium]|nr:YhcH/YjgK/YiaL family protein [bacterium]HPR87082.1 YhcH/YjgK/YiaL family protein [bacterium]